MAASEDKSEDGLGTGNPSPRDLPDDDRLPVNGSLVKKLMREQRLTNSAVATNSDLSVRIIQLIRKGGHRAMFDTISSLASALKVPWQRLVVGYEEPGQVDGEPPDQRWLPSGRLPHGLGLVYGRKRTREWLDEAWQSPNVCLAYLEAVGGGGKTAVVSDWLAQFQRQHNGVRAYEFSFNGQELLTGSGSSATFFTHAFRHFSLGDPSNLPVEIRAERLAAAVLKAPTVMVLDGIEVLQNKPGQPREGFFSDPGVRALVRIMAAGCKSRRCLLVLTTQLRLAEVRNLEGKTVRRHELKGLTAGAAKRILDSYDVRGRPSEVLAPLHRHSRGHPLTLHLLGSFIQEKFGGDGRRWEKYWTLQDDLRVGIDVRWVMERYQTWLEAQPAKVQLLRIVSLFDGPADPQAIASLLKGPPIRGLTDQLRGLDAHERQTIVEQLRRARLLVESDGDQADWLDTHAIIRDHFRTALRAGHRQAWKQGNLALYRHYRASVRRQAQTKAEAERVHAAIAHACRADRESDALRAYESQIHSRNADSAVRRFGLFGDDLVALYAFFDPDSLRVTHRLPADGRVFVLEQAASRLRWLGRLDECCQMMEEVVELRDKEHARGEAYGVPLRYLAECRLLRGELDQGLAAAEAALAKAKRNWIDVVAALTICGHSHHLLGDFEQAQAYFQRAVAQERDHEGPEAMLPSVRGFRHHELLLDQGKFDEVIDCCERNLNRKPKPSDVMSNLGPVNEGIYWLGIGLAKLRKAVAAKLLRKAKEAESPLNKALDYFHQSGRREFINQGFLARAELRLALRGSDRCREDLSYVASEAQYDEMWRLDVDRALLEIALLIETSSFFEAEKLLDATAKRIDRMHYGRRVPQLDSLELALIKSQGAKSRR